jgi:hypothetical protein
MNAVPQSLASIGPMSFAREGRAKRVAKLIDEVRHGT